MSKIYLINVGANTSHSGLARSPVFKNGSFIYVSFPHPGQASSRPYPCEALPFIRNVDPYHTHLDPDWENLTYGDNCRNPRASALRHAAVGDALLFWGLLWHNDGDSWEQFNGDREWYLIGALRIHEILEGDHKPIDARRPNRNRAARNVHFSEDVLEQGHRVFIGHTRYSELFERAVDLETTKTSGLLFETIRTANGLRLTRRGRRNWKSSTRSCRCIWDLDDPEEHARARAASKAILKKTGYDLLKGM